MPTYKQIQNRDKFTKDYKVKEIRRSLTKKARLKKEYLKTLKHEGYEISNKKLPLVSGNEIRPLKKKHVPRGNSELNRKNINEERRRLQIAQTKETKKKVGKEIRSREEKERECEKRKSRLTQKTKTGQPKMAPKIEDMLSKIRSNSLYTEHQ